MHIKYSDKQRQETCLSVVLVQKLGMHTPKDRCKHADILCKHVSILCKHANIPWFSVWRFLVTLHDNIGMLTLVDVCAKQALVFLKVQG